MWAVFRFWGLVRTNQSVSGAKLKLTFALRSEKDIVWLA